MTAQNKIKPTLDYIKYVLPLDNDRIQQLGTNLNTYEMENKAGFKWGQTAKLSIMESTPATGGRRRLVLEAWGVGAEALLELMNYTYLEHVVRLDYRRELAGVGVKEVESFLARCAMQKRGRRNVQTFRSEPRRKNHQRDIGGLGVYFGSRKSDSHTAAYVRGDEAPAIEHRFQGRKAADIACEALGVIYDREQPGTHMNALMPVLERYAQTELTTATGYTSWEKLALAMRDDRAHMDKLNQASQWLETPEEQRFWDGLSQEEQLDMQGPGYVPASALRLKTFDQTDQTVGVQLNAAGHARVLPPEPDTRSLEETKDVLERYNRPEDDGHH